GFGLAAKPLVCGSDSTLAVATFEPAHHEVRTRYLLEVVDEGIVHRCTTERADDRHGLRCELLCHYHAKAGCDLRNEPDQDWRAFRQHPAFGDEARGFRDRFGEQPAGSEIPALRRIRLAIARAQGEYLEAGEGALRVREILPLAARDVSDRPQHDDGRNRKFYRQRGETKAATHGPRRRPQRLCFTLAIGRASYSLPNSYCSRPAATRSAARRPCGRRLCNDHNLDLPQSPYCRGADSNLEIFSEAMASNSAAWSP